MLNEKNIDFCKINRKIVLSIFTLYLLILFWAIVFKMCIPEFVSMGYIFLEHNVSIGQRFLDGFSPLPNLEWPKMIRDFLSNVIAFLPLGLILPLVFKRYSIIRDALISFFISIILEVIQTLTRLGYFAYTDVIFNSIGAILGSLIAYVLLKCLNTKFINITLIVALTICILCSIIAIVLFSLNYQLYIPYFDFAKYPYLL